MEEDEQRLCGWWKIPKDVILSHNTNVWTQTFIFFLRVIWFDSNQAHQKTWDENVSFDRFSCI